MASRSAGERDGKRRLAPRASARVLTVCAFLIALAAHPVVGHAQDEPSTRVGRVADFAGQLYLSPEDRAVDWAEVGLNTTITTGDNLWVTEDGRAEIDYGGGQFRLYGDTNLHVSRLDDRQVGLFVVQGGVVVRVRYLDAGEVAWVDTPNTQVQFTQVGLYRVDLSADRQTTIVTVREGEAQAALAGGTLPVLPGQTMALTGSDAVTVELRNAALEDGFDAWSGQRDTYYDQSQSAAYLSPQTVGYADLDGYGSWHVYPDYGPVWFPDSMPSGWVPYSDGYWTSVGGWGMTWVDYAPWGYAPFHYGRWASINGRWGWCPGRRAGRAAWAPALVAWRGGGDWMATPGSGSRAYAWLPLGWRDPYVPAGRTCSARCWTRYNQPFGVTARERPRTPPASYANAHVPGAIVAVPGTTLARGQPVAPNRLVVPPQIAAAAPTLSVPPALMPARGGARPVAPSAGPPRGSVASTPPAARGVPTGGSQPVAGTPPMRPAPAFVGSSPTPGVRPMPPARVDRNVNVPPVAPPQPTTPMVVPGQPVGPHGNVVLPAPQGVPHGGPVVPIPAVVMPGIPASGQPGRAGGRTVPAQTDARPGTMAPDAPAGVPTSPPAGLPLGPPAGLPPANLPPGLR